jgi:RecB family exonuclease
MPDFTFDPSHTDETRSKAVLALDAVTAPIKTCSFSGLKEFEDCKYSSYLSRVKRFKRPSGAAANRGTAIHDLAENYVDGTLKDLPKELEDFSADFTYLRDRYRNEENTVHLEEDWGYKVDWTPTDWSNPELWLLMKLDSFVCEDATSARVIDYKSGKKFGNEIKHSDQGMLYGIGAFERYPDLQYLNIEFWYLDHNDRMVKSMTRKRSEILKPRYYSRLIAMTTCTDFPPNPSTHGCRWCPHKETGNCEWAM